MILSLLDLHNLFPQDAASLEALAQTTQEKAATELARILKQDPKVTIFKDGIEKIDSLLAAFYTTVSIAYTLTMVSTDSAVRHAAEKAVSMLDAWYIEHISLNKNLYSFFKEYYAHKAPKEDLSKEQLFFVTESLRGMKRAGLELPDATQQKLATLKKELSDSELAFSSRINNDQRVIEATGKELAGLPESFLAKLKKQGDYYLLGTDTPTYTVVMENCSNQEIRKKLFLAYSNRAYPENTALLEELRVKRHELATLLGYTSYAAYEIEDSMAQSVEKVEEFLTSVGNAVQAQAAQENAFLQANLPAEVSLTDSGKIRQWDSAYIKAEIKKKQLALDENKIAEYFPLEHTIKQLLWIYEQFFAITLKEAANPDLWHPDIRVIEVFRQEKLLGYLLLDLHPRAYKYTHACEIDIIKAHASQTAVVVVLANFPASSANEPSLLKYNDVVTFFHEFGHAIHDLLSDTQIISFAGTNVKRDFVELPSQMLEEWLWQPEIIKLVSCHYTTKEPLSAQQIESLAALKNFCKADFIERQLSFAWLSLRTFSHTELDKTVYEIKKEIHSQLRNSLQLDPEDHFEASFGHLTGYGARYYGYLWSQVYAKDLFMFIKQKNGLLCPELGQKYAKEILSKGGSCNPEELLITFLGRKPSAEAFYASLKAS
jgi:thimet oligopeptidase